MIKLPPIIGLTGLMGSGKTTAANILMKYDYKRFRFAGVLKAMLSSLGLSNREIDGDFKEKPCALLGGKTPRHAMQTLGTEWGRSCIDGDLWVRVLMNQIEDKPLVVIDDVRFPNEAAAIKERGGVVWRIQRLNTEITGHVSEFGQFDIDPDLVIENDGSITDLNESLQMALEDYAYGTSGHQASS